MCKSVVSFITEQEAGLCLDCIRTVARGVTASTLNTISNSGRAQTRNKQIKNLTAGNFDRVCGGKAANEVINNGILFKLGEWLEQVHVPCKLSIPNRMCVLRWKCLSILPGLTDGPLRDRRV